MIQVNEIYSLEQLHLQETQLQRDVIGRRLHTVRGEIRNVRRNQNFARNEIYFAPFDYIASEYLNIP